MSILETRPSTSRTSGARGAAERRLRWPDEAACAASAAALARCPGLDAAIVELRGPLGAGKTTFVRHLLRAFGVTGHVKSPTYALLEPYEVVVGSEPLAIRHFDFFRFDDPNEWEEAGFRDIFASPGLKLVEWPDKAAGLLPVADLRIDIEPVVEGDSDARLVRFVAGTPRGNGLLP